MLSALRNFFLTFFISALIFGGIAYFIVGFVLDTLSVTISADHSIDTVQPEYPETTEPDIGGDKTSDEKIEGETFNILLVGTDYQPELFHDYDYEETWEGEGFPDKRSRPYGADMLILVRIDKENRKFLYCPIPRNTRVLVDGIYMQLGDVLAKKGIAFLCGKVTGLTGMQVHFYASLNVGGIADLVDTIGGVSYYVPEDMSYSDPEQNLTIALKKGMTQLDGNKAEQLLRYVGYTGGTNARMATAVQFLQAMTAKFTNVSYLTKAADLYKKAAKYITTNFTVDDLINNLDLIFCYSKFEVKTVTYPGSNKSYDGISYFEPSLTSALEIFRAYQ